MDILPCGITLLDNQVAGHVFQEGKKTIGILKQQDGKILKPATKRSEVIFYESLQYTKDPVLTELRSLIPAYYGTCKLKVGQENVEFIILENVTLDMKEPNVIDIKIGKITSDLNATAEKIEAEKKKYSQTKQELGLCLPGFEVHDLYSPVLLRFGKEHGKNLNKESFIDSLKIFLNTTSPQRAFTQHLLVQILGQLWRILYWCQNQTKLLIFSSSILIVYDTVRLRKCQKLHEKRKVKNSYNNNSKTTRSKPRCLGFVDQLPQKTGYDHDKQWHMHYDDPVNAQFLKNTVEKELQVLKEEYFACLQKTGLDNIDINHQWVKVKMIDFAHVFHSTDDHQHVDENYLEGIVNLVQIIENLFIESVEKSV